MDTQIETSPTGRLRTLLLELARHQDELATKERSATPYWKACPDSVAGHLRAAQALRDEAEHLV